MRLLVVALLAACALSGCSRSYYRRSADGETYGILAQRIEPQWPVPSTNIVPPPPSRLADPYDPDHEPLPPDDPTAHRLMLRPNGMKGSKHFYDDGEAPSIEDPAWRAYLQLGADGTLRLSPERAVELGLLNSREYQLELEDLYLVALRLTLERFEFDLHWFFSNLTVFDHFGSSETESNTLTTASNLGFTKAFAAGGQLLVEFANRFVFQFRGEDHMTVSSNILINFVQPLLRNAGRRIRLEALTQAERDVLYAVRAFARFRVQFGVELTTGREGYLQLLLLTQSTRNQEENLVSQERNVRLHEALYRAGIRSRVQVEQAFQGYQVARRNVLQNQAAYETLLDTYKIALGLPPSLPVRLDDSLLAQFQLNDTALTDLKAAIDRFAAEFRQLDQAPSLVNLQEGFKKLKTFNADTIKLVGTVREEIERWKAQPAALPGDQESVARERAAQQVLAKELNDLEADLRKHDGDIDKSAGALAENKRTEGWEGLQKRTQEQGEFLTELLVIETQARVYLIRLQPVRWQLNEATQYALENRLDLMNRRGLVVDAWRKMAVTANALKSDLNVFFNADIATPPGGNNPVGFRASASDYQVGFQFDAPLNRMAERNAYRFSQIVYQRARRDFMALDDGIQQAVRNDLRFLELGRLNFDIARQGLISAARQVIFAEKQLRDPARETSTQDYLTALAALLDQKQNLIGTWVAYETSRRQLLLDLEVLQLDERGQFNDEPDSDQHAAGSGGPVLAPGPALQDPP